MLSLNDGDRLRALGRKLATASCNPPNTFHNQIAKMGGKKRNDFSTLFVIALWMAFVSKAIL